MPPGIPKKPNKKPIEVDASKKKMTKEERKRKISAKVDKQSGKRGESLADDANLPTSEEVAEGGQGSSGVYPLVEAHPPTDAVAPMQEVVYVTFSNMIDHQADESSGVVDVSLEAIIGHIEANPTHDADALMDENELEDRADPKVAEEKEMAMAESSSKRNLPASKVSKLDAVIQNLKMKATRAADVAIVQHGLKDRDNQEVIMLSDEDDEIGDGHKEEKEIGGKVDDDIENANAQDNGVVQIGDAVTEERVAMAENSSEQNSPLLNVAKIDAIHCHNEMNDTRAADMPMVQNRLEDGDDQEVIMLSDDEVEHGHKANEELGGKVDDAIKEANEQDNGLEPNALALIEEENAAERSPAHNLPRAKVAEIDTYELDPSNAAGLGEEMAMDEGSPEQNLPQGEVAGFDENVPVPPQEVAFVAALPEVVAPPQVDIVAPPPEVAINDAPPEFVVVAAPPQVRTPPRDLPRFIYTEAEAKEAFDVLREEDSPLSLAEHRNGNIIIQSRQMIQGLISHNTTYDASRNVLLASRETLQAIHGLQIGLQAASQEWFRIRSTKSAIRERFVTRCLIRESCRVSFVGFDRFPMSFAHFKERYSVRFAEDQNENRGNVEEANAEYNGYAPFQGHGAEH